MKLFKKIISAVAVVFMLFSLSGCSFTFSSFDNLLRPPKLAGKYQGLQDSFENKVKSFSLVTPENGLFQSAFVTFDIDSDGDEEAFVFYKTEESNDIVNMYFFDYENDEWCPITSTTGLGNSVDQISFVDLNNDGKYEVIVGWILLSSKNNKIFSVYSQTPGSIIELSNYPYSAIKTADIDGNGNDDIFAVCVTSNLNNQISASAKVYSFDSKLNTMNIIGEVKTDGNVSGYDNIYVENVKGKNYIYVDSLMGDNGMFTDVIYWDDNENILISPLFDSTTESTKSTWRNTKISCQDIDGDNLYEIPVSVEMNGALSVEKNDSGIQNLIPESSLCFIKWNKFVNSELKPLCYSVVNDKYNYFLEIKASWVGRITVLNNDGQWDFYRYDSLNNKTGDLLFSINVIEKSSLVDMKKYEKYSILKSSSSYDYLYSISEEGKSFGVTKENIEKIGRAHV